MNWIAEQFEKLKARVEAHIPATNKALNDLNARVSGAETYTQKAVQSVEARVSELENRPPSLQVLASVNARVEALEQQLQKAPAP